MPLYEVFESFPTWCILKVFKIKCLAEQPVAYFFTQSSVLPQLLIAFNFDFLTILLGIRRMSPVYTWMIIVSECPDCIYIIRTYCMGASQLNVRLLCNA